MTRVSRSYIYNVGEAFADVAQRHSERPALRYPESRIITYRDLDLLANRIAAMLLARGFKKRDVLAIVHTKALPCYGAMLAALKIGATYVNIDDQNPAARLQHIFSSARPKMLCGEHIDMSVSDAAEDAAIAVMDFADATLEKELASATSEPPAGMELVTGEDPAYIMYTSGSTGVPKGALMTHANVLNFANWCGERFGITAEDVLTNVNPMYFDNSVFDFYGSMLNGASMAPVSREALAQPAVALAQVEDARCTTWFSVPSLLIYLTTMRLLSSDRLPNIRQFVFGGEGYPKPELRKLFATFGARSRFVNVYGPTECTCICSAWDVQESDLSNPDGLVTLGPVAENFSALVIHDGRPVDAGEVGELCLLGPQVGRGYINDPERTQRSFVQNPVNDGWKEYMYKTGDLVRLDADGRKLHFVGRADNQVKHMGYRIELEEIEAAINRLDGVTQSAVVQKTGRAGVKILVAYLATDSHIEESQLRSGLDRFLPAYMIPQRFDVRSALPKNANGKIDRVTLANEPL